MLQLIRSRVGELLRRVARSSSEAGDQSAGGDGTERLSRGGGDGDSPLDAPPDEFPTEVAILQLLEGDDGWLRQQELNDALGCSAATISRTLSAMETDGEVERVSIGREKLVYLPDQLPPSVERTVRRNSEDDAPVEE